MDEKMGKIAWETFKDAGPIAACEAVLAEQRRRDEAAQNQQQAAQPPAPDGDVVEHMCEVFAASAGSDYHKGMFAAYAIAESAITARARKGWVPQSELSGIMSCGHRKRFESIIDGGHTPACQMCRAEKAEQQLASTVTLDAVEKALKDEMVSRANINSKSTFVTCVLSRLTQQEPTAQERVRIGSLGPAPCGYVVSLDGERIFGGMTTAKIHAERYAAGLRAELAALKEGK